MKVAHLTSVHSRFDNRIFNKECLSLLDGGYDVSLIVADGQGRETKDRIEIFDVGAPSGRLERIAWTTGKILDQAVKTDAMIYHLHDPELLPLAHKLKSLGKIVIFDSHEDFPADILTKPYLGKWARNIFSKMFGAYEKFVCRYLDFVVCATPAIKQKFIGFFKAAEDVNNFPHLSELDMDFKWSTNRQLVCYMGAITPIRGFWEIVDSMRLVKTNMRLSVAGVFSDSLIENKCRQNSGWSKVDYLGYVSRKMVLDTMAQSVAGLVTYLPAPNHIDSQPNKLFEYMSAGIPVIGSNFPLWKEIIEGNQCGICVDPTSPEQIASAIDFCANNQGIAMEMGARGRKAVLEKYNWNAEAPKLLGIYEKLIKEEISCKAI